MMNRRNWSKVIGVSLVVLGFAGASNGATTGAHFAAGNACRPAGSGTLIRTLIGGNIAWANDSTTNTLVVECAIPVSSSVTMKSVDFFVVDNTTTGAVECTGNNTTNILTNTGQTATQNSGVGSASPNLVTFNANMTDAAPQFAWITCNIPPKSGANRSGLVAAQVVQ